MDRLPKLAYGLEWSDFLWAGGICLLTFTVSLATIGVLVVLLPSTFFLDRHDRRLWTDRHPAVRWSGLIAKNLLGVLLVLAGLGLSIPGVPGQGLLTILLGIILLDFPGKRRLERKIVSRPRVLRTLNRLRARFHRPPLLLADGEAVQTLAERGVQ